MQLKYFLILSFQTVAMETAVSFHKPLPRYHSELSKFLIGFCLRQILYVCFFLGGPLVKASSFGEHGPRYVIFGIVSVGLPSCGKFSLPAVYTNVSHYLPWIYEVIEGK